MDEQPEAIGLRSENRLKLGLFGANCSSGNAVTTLPERWSGAWKECLRLAQSAEEAGFEFMLPIGRWKGYGGATDYQGTSLETITWATGLLAQTRRITVFSTIHAPLLHPVVAAKQMVTAHHVGEGRFGLNIVCGWNEDEFEMFGVAQRNHEARYRYAQEWLDAVRRMWTETEEFDFEGEFFHLRKVRAQPKPYGGRRPLIMNAGVSATGQDFAARNCDALFISTGADTFENTAHHVTAVKTRAQAYGRTLDVYTIGAMTCRRTAREAREYYDYCIVEKADWAAVDNILTIRGVSAERMRAAEYENLRQRTASGLGSLELVGDPDQIAHELARLSAGGLSGVALTMVDYAKELPFFCSEVLPRLVRLGVRKA